MLRTKYGEISAVCLLEQRLIGLMMPKLRIGIMRPVNVAVRVWLFEAMLFILGMRCVQL